MIRHNLNPTNPTKNIVSPSAENIYQGKLLRSIYFHLVINVFLQIVPMHEEFVPR